MDGQRANAVILEGGPKKFSADIRRAGEKLFECITDPEIRTVVVSGFNGVGKWRIVEYANQKLKGSHLFDVQILVQLPRRDFSDRSVIKEIAHQLGLTPDLNPNNEDRIDEQRKFILAMSDIYRSLLGRRLLIILGDAPEYQNLDFMEFFVSKGYSKVVIVGNDTEGRRFDQSINLDELSNDMLREEAADVAHSTGIKGWLTPEAVLDCCLYLWFFASKEYSKVVIVGNDTEGQRFDQSINLDELSNDMLPGGRRDMTLNVEWLTRNWIAEGFIIRKGTVEDEEEEDSTHVEKIRTLLRKLELRSLVEFNERRNDWEVPGWVVFKNSRATEGALTHGRYWIEESPPGDNNVWEYILRMSLWGIDTSTHLPQVPPKCPKLSTLQLMLIDNPYSSVEFIIPDPFFEQMQCLRVLHLYNLHIKSLPPSIAFLHNLSLLRIYGCDHLESLPSSFQALHKLEFLEVSKSSSFMSMPDDCFLQMTNLRFLLLDGSNINSLPSSVSKLRTLHQLILINSRSLMEIPYENFEYMQRLQVLDLSNDSNLKSLPSSLSEFINLRHLKLSNCRSLKMKLLPHVKKLPALEELHLCNCNSLEDIEDVSSSLGNILPKLRKLDLSGIVAIRRVFLIGCQSLESVNLNGVTSLQMLSLSGTIKRFPGNMTSDTGDLKCLNMLGMNHLHEIEWDDLSTELEHLNINQCGTINSSADNNEWTGNTGGAYIRVSNHRLLQSLKAGSKLWGTKCFSRFYICISPCQENEPRRRFVYANIGSKIQTCNLPHPSHFDRHLEIRGGITSPKDIDGVLSQTELFILCDNAFVQRLSHLGDVDEMTEMKECRVKECKSMERFFEGKKAHSEALSQLERIWMSKLASLRSVCEGRYGSQSFTILKHIYLEFCPRLIVVFSSGVCLPSLETLQIKFCSRLEAVFRGVATENGSLQRLHTVCLWELPKLESICSGVWLPALMNLRVSGCRKLNKLPLRLPPDNAFAASTPIGRGLVEVEGESAWWDSLKLEGESIKRHVHFKERRPFRKC